MRVRFPPRLPPTLSWDGRALRLLDQTRLPEREVYVSVRCTQALIHSIRRLVVRGAPALGCAGAYGVALAWREACAGPAARRRARFLRLCLALAACRPTAVNLQWAVKRCLEVAEAKLRTGADWKAVDAVLEAEALAVHEEDARLCEAIGRRGAVLLPRRRAVVWTHCNAGALATGGAGTALAVCYAAAARGTKVRVFVDETRPLLQGARLTAWELARAGLEATVVCDGMAAALMRTEHPDAVIVGADRIAANGDVANKIGTYGLAIIARRHGVPFYVAAPYSTLDARLPDGARIPIEERGRDEVSKCGGRRVVPVRARVRNPAFDVTPAELVSAIITERGVLRPPYLPAAMRAAQAGRRGPAR